jgi:hypothetical protein
MRVRVSEIPPLQRTNEIFDVKMAYPSKRKYDELTFSYYKNIKR